MRWPAILLLATLAAVPAKAADLAAGKQIFARCRICHTVAVAAPSTVGPNLHGLFGRKAGSLHDYDYSPAMQRSEVVWTDKALAKFLRDPKAFIPGNKMGFPGIDNAEEIKNLLAYLKEATD
jgi:cytochrome c